MIRRAACDKRWTRRDYLQAFTVISILIADDSTERIVDIKHSIEGTFPHYQILIDSAESRDVALVLLSEKVFDILIVDLIMPYYKGSTERKSDAGLEDKIDHSPLNADGASLHEGKRIFVN